MFLTERVWIFPHKKHSYLLYAPLNRLICEVDYDAVQILNHLKSNSNLIHKKGINPSLDNFLNFLVTYGVLGEKKISLPIKPKANFNPTSLILLPPYDCNLRCVYCYANSGDYSRKKMDIKIAKVAIDSIFNNAKKCKKRNVSISFHGGGEPTVA